jgi:hypothetical protein
MNYEFNLERTPMLLPWYHVFQMLSIQQFCQVYDLLDFPFCPPDDLRQIAHDFVLILGVMMGDKGERTGALSWLKVLLHYGETVSVYLLHGTPPDAPYEEKRDALFKNTFTTLERLGYANVVYEWGKETDIYLKYANHEKYLFISSLSSWCTKLKHWDTAIRRPPKPPAPPEPKIYTDEWWELMEKRPKRFVKPEKPLLLSDNSRKALQDIIQEFEARKTRIETTINQFMEAPKSRWEEYILKWRLGNMRMRHEGQMRINLQQWGAILDTLSPEDMNILNEWAIQYQDESPRFKVPLPDFRIES